MHGNMDMDSNSTRRGSLEDDTKSNETTATIALSESYMDAQENELKGRLQLNGRPKGLRRQPTKYPHGLGINVQTIDERTSTQTTNKQLQQQHIKDVTEQQQQQQQETCYAQAPTTRSSWDTTRPPQYLQSGTGTGNDENSHRKYKISMICKPENMAELQVRRYKYPLTGNYYLDAQEPTKASLALLEYAKHYCRWKYLRWPLIFIASVLLFFGLITYCIWLHDVSVAREQYLSSRRIQFPDDEISVTANTIDLGTTTTTERSHGLQESTILRAISARNRQRPREQKLTTLEYSVFKGSVEWGEKEEKVPTSTAETTTASADETVVAPEQIIRFTSGHQNSFGVPIEDDERILRIINGLFSSDQPQASTLSPLTKVSPTIPPVRQSKPTSAMSAGRTTMQESGCYSTSLSMCQGVLDYDLTHNSSTKLSDLELGAYRQLIDSNCSARAVEFVCAALEPECRSSHIGVLPPCRRICKAILEACSIVIASSDELTETFDCSLYPDSNDPLKCEDPTRRRGYCYDNEFECYDRTCIPYQWQCDNIKDCANGEDEGNCIVCEKQDEFRCRSNEKCVSETVRCDLNYDCFDGSDEEDCDEYGSGEEAAFDEAALNSFPRIFSYASFLSPNQSSDQLYTYITATTDDEAGTKIQVHEVTNQTLGISKEEVTNSVPGDGPRGFVNFRDSKEIMMTSDSENKFKYSSARTNRTSSKFSVSNTTPLQPAASSRVGVTTDVPKLASGSCASHQLRCVSGKCITVQQLCDRKMDCPDGADEFMCVYKERNSSSSSSSSSSSITRTSSRSRDAFTTARTADIRTVRTTTIKRRVKT